MYSYSSGTVPYAGTWYVRVLKVCTVGITVVSYSQGGTAHITIPTFGFQSKKLSVIAKIVLQYLEIMESSITQAATKPANWERLKDRVKSWIESEHHCVTAQRICQTFNISRVLGSQLLKEILQTDRRHQISACSQTQDGNVTGT